MNQSVAVSHVADKVWLSLPRRHIWTHAGPTRMSLSADNVPQPSCRSINYVLILK